MTGVTLGFWTLDILACFCVGYYARDGTLVVSLRKIAKQQLVSTDYRAAAGRVGWARKGEMVPCQVA